MTEKTIVGLDLDQNYTQISFYNERSLEPETVNVSENPGDYLIETPPGLFPMVENKEEQGVMALKEFLSACIALLKPAVHPKDVCIMVTMRTIAPPWPDAIRASCHAAGVEPDYVFLQTHRESFCCYTLNQKKDLWLHRVALFEYEDDCISSYIMNINYGTRPALVSAEKGKELKLSRLGMRDDRQWNEQRDQLFLKMIRETFQNETISSVYLIGENFDKTWAVESLQYLCYRRHVFQGRNLYTKGACYSAMYRMGIGKKLSGYLYYSEDMIETNLSMQMQIRGKQDDYMLISAGVNWFEAYHSCELIADGTKEIVIYGKPMVGGDVESYSIVLKGLPERKDRTVRLLLEAKFTAKNRCRITVRDLGFGDFYPPSGQVWESVLEV